jgi:hypothetical protein
VSEQELNAILFGDAAAHNAGVSLAAAEDMLEHGPAATSREILPLSAPSLAPAWDDAWTAGIPPGGLDEPPLAAPSSARAEDVSFQEHGGESPGCDSAQSPRSGALEAWDGRSAGSGSGSGAGKEASCGGEWKEEEDEDEDEDDSDEEEVMALHADVHTDTLAALGGAPSCVALGPLALAVGVGARVAVLPAPWDEPGAAPTLRARALALPDAERDAVTCLAVEPGAGGGALGPAGLLAGFASGGLAAFCAQSGALLRALPGAHGAAVLHVRCCAPRGGRSAFVSADATGVVMTHEASRGLLRLRVDSTTLLDGSARDDGPRTGAILALAVPPRAAADALRAPGADGAAPPAVAMCSLEMVFVAQLAPRTRVACKARPAPRAPRSAPRAPRPAALIAHGESNLSRDWSPAPRALRAVGSAGAARPAPRRGGCRAPAPARDAARGAWRSSAALATAQLTRRR